MKIGGLGNSLLLWLLVSGGLHAAALLGAGGWGDFSAEGTGYIEVALSQSPRAAGRAPGAADARMAGVATDKMRPSAGSTAVASRATPVTAAATPAVSTSLAAPTSLPSERAAHSPGEAGLAASSAAETAAAEGPSGEGSGAEGGGGGEAAGAGSGGGEGGSPAGGTGGLAARTPPRCLEMRQPAYPGDARRRRWEGEVRLRLHVDSAGRVREVRVDESSGYDLLDRAARDAVRGWKFQPARLGPVAVEDDAVFVTVGFELDRS